MGILELPAIEHQTAENKFDEVVPENLATLEGKLSWYCLSEQDLQAKEASLDKLLFLTGHILWQRGTIEI